jgi:ABC-type transport system substrate-binding protein
VPQDTTTVWTPDTFQKKNFQLTAVYRLYTGQSPDPYLQHYTTKGRGAGNDARWSDPEVDAIVAKQLVEFDEAKQRQIIIDAQRLILSKFPPIIKPYAPFVYTANWDYYHDARFEQAYVGTFGGYSWIDSDSPNYPKR